MEIVEKDELLNKNCMWSKEELYDLYNLNKQNLSATHIGKYMNLQLVSQLLEDG